MAPKGIWECFCSIDEDFFRVCYAQQKDKAWLIKSYSLENIYILINQSYLIYQLLLFWLSWIGMMTIIYHKSLYLTFLVKLYNTIKPHLVTILTLPIPKLRFSMRI